MESEEAGKPVDSRIGWRWAVIAKSMSKGWINLAKGRPGLLGFGCWWDFRGGSASQEKPGAPAIRHPGPEVGACAGVGWSWCTDRCWSWIGAEI